MGQRQWKAGLSLITLLAASGGAWAGIPQGDIIVRLEPVATGLIAPVSVTHAGDGSGRLFIVEQSGQIRILQNGNVLAEPFLDISDKLPDLNTFFDERGLLGLAFHPDYKENGRFFIRHSVPREGSPDEPCFGTPRGCHAEVLAEYAVSAGNPNLADPNSEQLLFMIDEPQFNHNAGEVAFGPDGYLYFSLGDGGGANDGLADDPPSHGPFGNGQNIETALGSVLRIDVDGGKLNGGGRSGSGKYNSRVTAVFHNQPEQPEAAANQAEGSGNAGLGGLPYAIPADNPFVNAPGLDEIYAYGLRNPFKFSFDDGPGGDGSLYLADVGQNLFEEVNIITNGGNYGWVIREGLHCFDPFNPLVPPEECPDTGPLGEPLIDPIAAYSHPASGFDPEGGITVIGGFVYRGNCSPQLRGHYIFGDFAQDFTTPSGTLYYLDESPPNGVEIRQLQIGVANQPYDKFLKGFGEGEDGEIYACGSTALAPFGDTGVIEQIVQDTVVRKFSADLAGDNEVPPVETDTTGKFMLRFKDDFTQAGFRLRVNDGQAITQAHLHCAPEGVNGPVVAFLFGMIPGGFDVNGPLASFVLTNANIAAVGADCVPHIGMEINDLADLAQALRDGNVYVNVHSVANPGGEVRGQVISDQEIRPCPDDE